MGRRRFSVAHNKTTTMQGYATMQLTNASDDVHIAGSKYIPLSCAAAFKAKQ